jgi:hypothetical protein
MLSSCRILCLGTFAVSLHKPVAEFSSLVGHNIRNRFIKDKVNNIMLSLHKNIPPSNWRTTNYWKLVDDVIKNLALLPGGGRPIRDGYLRALLNFDDNKAVSNLVHLVHKSGTPWVYQVRQVSYEKVIEIPYLLSSYAEVVEHPQDHAEVKQDDEKEITEPQAEEFEEEEERHGDVAANADAGDSPETSDEAVASFAPDLDESLRTNEPSEEEEKSACQIQKAYRRYVLRRSSRAVNAEIDAIFMACLKETQSSEWRQGYYCLLFLGPLPHLLVCLERGIALTNTAKAKMKGLLNKESHSRLEELGRQRSEIASVNLPDVSHGLMFKSVLQGTPQGGHEVAQAARTFFAGSSCP